MITASPSTNPSMAFPIRPPEAPGTQYVMNSPESSACTCPVALLSLSGNINLEEKAALSDDGYASREEREPAPGNLQGTDIRRGLYIFFFLTVAALLGIFLYTNTGNTLSALKRIRTDYLILVLGLSAVDILLGAARNHIYFMAMEEPISFMTSIKANLANIFMGAVTPSQSAGGPAQLFVYHNAGASVGKAISVGVLNLLATMIFFTVSAGFSAAVLGDSFNPLISGVLYFCLGVFLLQLAVYVFAVFKPETAVRAAETISGVLAGKFPRFRKRIMDVFVKVASELTVYRQSCSAFLGKKIYVPAAAVVLTFVLYFNKFLMAYFIMKGIGESGDFLTVVCIQALVLFISYYSISPGAGGIAELSIATLMAPIIGKDSLVIFTVLQRFFILYLPGLLGAMVVYGEFRKKGRIFPRMRGRSGNTSPPVD